MAQELHEGDIFKGTHKGVTYAAEVAKDGTIWLSNTQQFFPTLAQASKAVRGYSGGGQFWTPVVSEADGKAFEVAVSGLLAGDDSAANDLRNAVATEATQEEACTQPSEAGTLAEANQEESTMSTATAEPEVEPQAAEEAPKRARTTDPLEVGQKYTAKFKGAEHTATVVDVEGKPKVKLENGSIHSGLSSAGKSITGYAVTAGSFWTKA